MVELLVLIVLDLMIAIDLNNKHFEFYQIYLKDINRIEPGYRLAYGNTPFFIPSHFLLFEKKI